MSTNRRNFITTAVYSGSGLAFASAVPLSRALAAESDPAAFKLDLSGRFFQGPEDAAQWPAFREALKQWREQTKASLKYDDGLYRRPEFAWAASNYCCCKVMMFDERFHDQRSGRFTVASFLEEGRREFGGFDSVIFWQAYPRLGADPRNQFDFYRDQPGGLAGLKEVIREFRRHGVRTLIDYNPWDIGTRRDEKTDLDTLADLVATLQVDGVFLDTLPAIAGLRGKLDAVSRGVILEGELLLPFEMVQDQHASWAQDFLDSPVPGVMRQKWLERRHMQHQIQRWNRDHSGELHMAWMNGSGMMVWENVFGACVPWNPRDRSTLRAMLPIQRRFNALFAGEGWTPLAPTECPGVYASLWEGKGVRLWTLINRLSRPVKGAFLKAPHLAGHTYFDLVKGKLTDRWIEGQSVVLSGEIPARGIGCFVSGQSASLGADFNSFLEQQSATHARALVDSDLPVIETQLQSVAKTARPKSLPAGMVALAAAELELSMQMRFREGGFYDSAPQPCTFGEEAMYCHASPTPIFRRRVAFNRFAIDETLVTNAQFAAFLKESDYHPAQSANFLKHWQGTQPPQNLADHPVVYVDLADARAYAKWAGKRLPTEEEWQYAAQGTDARKYPWGKDFDAARCNDGYRGGTTPVRAFPAGRSPFGCYDMCGNVWQWTESERTDGRTRFCILRGGSWFKAEGSMWYTDGGPQPADFAMKFLMCGPGLDRCSTIGFRCVVDLE